MATIPDGVSILPNPSEQRLNQRQVVDYRNHRERLLRWMCSVGKDEDAAEGYADDTVRRRACDLDQFYRWVWTQAGGYTTEITTDHADEYLQEIAFSDDSRNHKQNVRKSLQTYFRYREIDWEPPHTFAGRGDTMAPREYLTREERKAIREAALEYGTVPAYNSLSPDEREQWKKHLAQRYRKPTRDVTPEDFKRANGFKIPSIINVALDGGFRPAEIGRAKASWVDTENALLRIPVEDSTKNRNNWTVSLRRRTGDMLAEWLAERRLYGKYDGREELWLTREGNPYCSRTLNYLFDRLCEVAEIDTQHRDLTFYAIRHSTGTFMTREDGLKSAASQLRRRTLPTKYDQSPPDERRKALERIE
ncbi:MAG: tyrosine-type recombinase/integrase [Haloplanus sp.]